MTILHHILERVAAAPVLLVACDFDGTISPLVPDPNEAAAHPGALGAITRLAGLRQTAVAVVSGRGLADLKARLPVSPRVHLVGSHGAEGLVPGAGPDEAARSLLSRLESLAAAAAAGRRGLRVESKPFGVALHYRSAMPDDARDACAAFERALKPLQGVHIRHGSMVLEAAVSSADKGAALRTLRQRLGASTVVFIGDDHTDEDVFAVLTPTDVSIKVGPGETRGAERLANPEEVARFLQELAESRDRDLSLRPIVPIQNHSVLSDQRTLAVVSPHANVNWLCLPRIDSSSIFAELLGGPHAGFFSIAPDSSPGVPAPTQHYTPDSFVLVTEWPGLRITDYLDCGGGRAFQRPGRSDLVRVIEGDSRALVRFAPRADFGRAATRLIRREGGLEVEGAADPMVLYSPGVVWTIADDGPHQTATSQVDPSSGPVTLELRFGVSSLLPHIRPEPERRHRTEQFWKGWASSLRLPSRRAELVRRSALVLKALIFGPSGAISAAATTSLPEHLGGVRNWDYRYCWPRDAALSAAALVRIGNTGVAMRLLDWLLSVVDRCESPDRLRPLYGVAGETLGPEAELSELCGYAGSRPVRIGNAAAGQVQLDVFGPITNLVAMLAERGEPVSPDHWRLTRAKVQAVEARWGEPDHGIWEVRGPKRHHVHSRLMCWHTVDRALAVERSVSGTQNASWIALRDRIREDLLTHGYKASVGAFTAAYDGEDLDASALAIGLTGFLPPGDDRFIQTVNAVNRSLRRGPLVYRYSTEDGLPGPEGGFLLCTSWLIECLVILGRVTEAESLFAGLAALAGPTGLFTEEFDETLEVGLGNFPQEYSHLGLINAAVALENARPA